MRADGRLHSVSYDLDGGLLVTFKLRTDKDQLDAIKDTDLIVTAGKETHKRSKEANRYFWQLCDKIAKHKDIKSTKEKIYIRQLNAYGVFNDVDVLADAIPILKQTFRDIEIMEVYRNFNVNHWDDRCVVRCYLGSSHYNNIQMNELIQGTVEDAKELEIEVLTPKEIAQMVSCWRANK